MAKLKFSKQQKTIQELDAIEELYGGEFTRSKLVRILLMYSIIPLAFGMLLYRSILWTGIWIAITCIYSFAKVIPGNIKMDYNMKAHNQRNRVINVITQSLASGNTSVKQGIKMAVDNTDGELHSDMAKLYAKLLGDPTPEATHQAFLALEEKYKEDVFFSLFLEQLEVGVGRAHPDIRTLVVFRESHNTEFSEIKKYREGKRKQLKMVVVMLFIAFSTCLIAALMLTYKKWVVLYNHSLAGFIITTIFMCALFKILDRFTTQYQDDSINSIKL